MVSNEVYSFTDGFSRYHQVQIVKEYCPKIIFIIEWGTFMYNVISFGLKNAPIIFSLIMIQIFKDFIHDFLEVHLDYWIVYYLMKNHVQALRLMFE